MERETVIILGIPIDNLSLGEAVDRVFALIDRYRRDGVPRQVATVNVDFIVNTLTWEQGGIRHPELLDILRRADLVTADGMPVVWMSKLLGCPLKERVTGADLVPALAAEAARRGRSLFLLGGRSGIAQQTAEVLQQRNPGLMIAGVGAPFVYTEGEQLADFHAQDAAIVAEINAARPDILLIAFGNPKQELWFARNASRLKVPVSIGIGGTFEFIVGTVSRAPLWVQRAGLEWIYRILMEPRRLWKRYAVGVAKFALHAWPAIRSYRSSRRRQASLAPVSDPGAPQPQWLQEDVYAVTLPPRLDALAVKHLVPVAERALLTFKHLVLDFGGTGLVDSSGLGFLVRLWKKQQQRGGTLHLVSLQGEILDSFRFNRVADLFRECLCRDRDEAMERIRRDQPAGASTYRIATLRNGAAVVTLRGRLDAAAMKSLPLEEILAQLSGRDCVLDLAGLSFADSSGLVALYRMQRSVAAAGHSCLLCAPSQPVRQLLRLTRLERFFTITDDRQILTDGEHR